MAPRSQTHCPLQIIAFSGSLAPAPGSGNSCSIVSHSIWWFSDPGVWVGKLIALTIAMDSVCFCWSRSGGGVGREQGGFGELEHDGRGGGGGGGVGWHRFPKSARHSNLAAAQGPAQGSFAISLPRQPKQGP